MDLLLGEHGEALLYGIIGTIMVIVICNICAGSWRQITPDYKTKINKNNGQFISQNKGKYPIIEADEIIYADYKNKDFDVRDFISVKDYKGNDIREHLSIYGTVNVLKKGIYKLRCVAVSENQLICTKYIHVIVE